MSSYHSIASHITNELTQLFWWYLILTYNYEHWYPAILKAISPAIYNGSWQLTTES